MESTLPSSISELFSALESALRSTPLPQRSGSRRFAHASEFMLMHQDQFGTHFKHIDSRNYLVISPSGSLSIPTGHLFQQGFFDKFQNFHQVTPCKSTSASTRPQNSPSAISSPPTIQNPPTSATEPFLSFSESDCSGVFDGFSVFSDADPGL